MKVSDFVINYLADQGVDCMFVVSGSANAHLIDAFTRTRKTRYIAMMHEQAAGFAAEGYSRIKGVPGVAIATSGPGGMNLITPIGNCFYDSVPCVFLTGQINSNFLRTDPGIRQVGFQETDIVAISSPITKYSVLIRKPEDIRFELEKAFFLATDQRPGPVLLDIPTNIQQMEINPKALIGFDPDVARPLYNIKAVDAQINMFLKDLKQAKRPVMLIGGGIRSANAVKAVQAVGKKLKIPVFPTWNALDIITSDYKLYGGRIGTYGGRGRNFGLQNSDLVLAVGCRISGRITGGNPKTFLRGARKYIVDIDQVLLQRKWQQVPFDVNIYCDAKMFLERLDRKLNNQRLPNFSAWVRKVMEWKEKYDPVRPEFYKERSFTHPYVFIRVLSKFMKKNDIVAIDCGGNIVIANHAFETKNGQRYFTNNGNSPMGFSFAGGLGAWFAAHKGQNVVTIIGDGGFNMNIQELQTLATYGIKLKTFIMNNHSYGIIKAFQDTNVESRYSASEPGGGYVAPDFVKIAQAYKIKTFAIRRNQELRDTIAKVLAFDGPVVCDVDCGEYYTYEPRVYGWAASIEDMYPYLPRDEFRHNMLIEPVEGWEDPPLPGKQIKVGKTGSHE